MSLHDIIQTLSKLATLHESLYELSKQKTEYLKSNDTEAIQKTLLDERKHVQAIEQLEKKRMALTEDWFKEIGKPNGEFIFTEMIEHVENEDDQKTLNELYERLVMAIAGIKQQEQLNRELTQQSLQFIELSLDLFEPTIKNLNYGNQKGESSHNRSIFDSKA
jgi:hypothetical protein